MLGVKGGSDIKIDAAAKEIGDRLSALLPGLWDPKAKGTPVDTQPLAALRTADAEAELAKQTLAALQSRLVDLKKKKDAALDSQTGTTAEALMNTLGGIEANIALTERTIKQMEGKIAENARVRPALVQRFKATVAEVANVATSKALREAQEEVQAGWKALEAAMSPHLDTIARARARMEALQGKAVAQAVQAKIEEQLTATQPIPTAKAG